MESAYRTDGRLADVIAAITVLAANHMSEATVHAWSRQLSKSEDTPDPSVTAHWERVFSEHPEFFLVYQWEGKLKAALRLRYADKTIDRITRRPHPDLATLSAKERANLTSLALSPEVTSELVSVAINLHSADLARRADSRFWLQLVGPILGLVGGVAVALFTHWIAKGSASKEPIQIEFIDRKKAQPSVTSSVGPATTRE